MPDIKVQLPDGNTASFPDGTAHHVMERAIQQHLGWKSPQTQAAANTNSNPAAQGEVRPSTQQLLNPLQSMQPPNVVRGLFGQPVFDLPTQQLVQQTQQQLSLIHI